MNAVRMLALGLFLAGMLACAAVFAQSSPFGQPQPGFVPAPANSTSARFGAMAYSAARNLQSESAALAQQYVKADKEDQKKEIRKKLSDLLSQQFDQHSQQQQKELEDLEKQIANLRSVLKRRLDSKSAIVERRLEQLVQEAEGLGWNAPGTPQPAYAPAGGGFRSFGSTPPGKGQESPRPK
jgi:hypothetical protein